MSELLHEAKMNQQGPDLPLAWNNNNNRLDKIYKPIVFRILNHRQQRIVIPKIRKMNEMSPMMAQLITLRVSRPWHRERKPARSVVTPWELGVQGDTKVGRVHGVPEMRQSLRERTWRPAKGSLQVFSKVLMSACIWGNDARPATVSIPTRQAGRPHHWEGT